MYILVIFILALIRSLRESTPGFCLRSTYENLRRTHVNRRLGHNEIFHGVPNHAIASHCLCFIGSAKTTLPRGRSIDGSSMAITLVNSCLHTSTVTAPEFEMSPPIFLEKSHLCLPVAKRHDR